MGHVLAGKSLSAVPKRMASFRTGTERAVVGVRETHPEIWGVGFPSVSNEAHHKGWHNLIENATNVIKTCDCVPNELSTTRLYSTSVATRSGQRPRPR
jgi:hypothetical protein